MISRLLLIVCSAVLLAACSREPDARLTRVNELIGEDAGNALAALDSIAVDSLSEADRHYYDLLTVKARDKAYITHTSDSLILDVMNYYEGKDLYPEALYYGGRVYSDLGDYPTALDYFQRGLEEVGETTPENMPLKGCLLSQTARLLSDLRLYAQAIPYMKETLTLDSLERDTFNLAYDHQLLGAIYMHQDSLVTADSCFKKAVYWAQFLPDEDQADMQMYEAACKLKQGYNVQATNTLKEIPRRVHTLGTNLAMIHASEVYLKENNLDSAYYYADRLVHSSDDNNRKNGYYILFHPNLFTKIPKDSISKYVMTLCETLEKYYDRHESQEALMQNSLYNYRIQQRWREEAENQADKYMHLTIILTFFTLLFVVIVLILRARKQALSLSLQTTIIKLNELQTVDEGEKHNTTSNLLKNTNNLAGLKDQLLNQIENLRSKTAEKTAVDDVLIESEICKKIQRYISADKAIPNESPMWEELERAVLSVSPDFKERLKILTGQDLKPFQYHIVLLIRSGIAPAQMATLLSRTKSTISYHRKLVGEMILGQKIDNVYIDDIIRCI